MYELKEMYIKSLSKYDVKSMSDIMCANIDRVLEEAAINCTEPYFDEFWSKRAMITVWDMFLSLVNHDPDRALKLIAYIPVSIKKKIGIGYYYGLCYYEMEEWDRAVTYFYEYLTKKFFNDNDLAWFFLGNALYKMEYYDAAINAYHNALNIKKKFTEAKNNLNLAEKYIQSNDYLELYPWKSYLNMNELSFYDIPIFINSRDRVNGIKKLIKWLLKNGYNNIYILDNDSTYKPLLDYYRHLNENYDIKVIFLKKNMGHTAIWDSNVLEDLNINTPYVYTDSDVVPEQTCPSDIVGLFLDYLRFCPLLHKVGFGIRTDDIIYKDAEKVKKIDSEKYYNIPIEDGAYFSGIDTTFALYGNHRMYSIIEAVRIKIPGAQLLHLPWYYSDNIPEDEKYYLEHANLSSSFKRDTFDKY